MANLRASIDKVHDSWIRLTLDDSVESSTKSMREDQIQEIVKILIRMEDRGVEDENDTVCNLVFLAQLISDGRWDEIVATQS